MIVEDSERCMTVLPLYGSYRVVLLNENRTIEYVYRYQFRSVAEAVGVAYAVALKSQLEMMFKICDAILERF